MRLMGFDVGSRTVGIAVSDLLGWTAQGVEIIRINEDVAEFGLERVQELVDKYQVTGFVLGLPKNMNNSIGPRALKAQEYGAMLSELFPEIPVDYIDERLTTVQAERMLVEQADTSRKKRKQVIDKLAAVMILQNYLDAHGRLTQG
ncbi:Holliday junction resolvase RuvX [Latilactobacillus graminis]|uniref:Putative pre-16S rRNA nuclease n=2 Tax=Latilactobacillus graminis TaxID=60519 RepID=A0AA89KYH0_9LACO|nr:Holliday junction resolvase RuvX [Latilactobacillus graminis]KRM24401.1 Holliday junction resolvase [Latilactobacillus graminis DSM 20719]QFP80048.1 Holliday junction resolvase RuvX [Latilactobacillus graminis]